VATICWVPPAAALTLDDVAARAQELAAAPYRKPDADLPEDVRNLDYDGYRDIRFAPSRALWRDAGLGFEVMFFHRGWHFRDPVRVNEVTRDGVREIPFDPGAFDYGKNPVDRSRLGGLGFAGLRVHFPLNTASYRDEALVFLGASYFRALGRGQRYGVSARGLAVDTALSSGEEFPRFVEFWIERPAPNAAELTVFALLDSPRAAGAYRFVLKPGVTTALAVDVRLFLRAGVGKLGMAPLTSMYFFGANQRPEREDYRPEVHDSDGLMIRSSTGEWLWRPLVSPRRLLVTSFALTDPLGFGLMQRERRFERFEDLEARYDLRPSAWIEPTGAWGPGRVELVQLPLPDETNDNIVAYWVPERVPGPREPIAYGYRILWQKERETRPPYAWVSQTRSGRGYARSQDETVQLHVDFVGPRLERLPRDADVEGVVSVDASGEIVEQNVVHNEVTGGWRVAVRFRRVAKGKPVELRAHLRLGTEVLSETWSYVHPPD
jgi:glucans biosynthesis protein